MFEDSTFESNGKIRTRSRRWMLVTFALNASVLLALILIPLIYPEALPRMASIMLMEAPAPLPETPRPVHVPPNAVAVHTDFNLNVLVVPSRIPRGYDPHPVPDVGIPPSGWDGGPGSSDTASLDNPFNGDHHVTVVEAKPKAPTPVSSGVMQGLLIRQVVPVYSAIAKAARIEGTVILQATISKTGTIENLHVVSGPAMLTQSAMDAVAQWRYRPYLLNGQPVEVETTVNVVFKLN
jgi:protein TonB